MIRGLVGSLKWHHYTAAELHAYTVSRTTDGVCTLTATVGTRDAFKMAQRPLVFTAPHKHGGWSWPVLAFTVTNNRIQARLGPMDGAQAQPVPPPQDLYVPIP